MVDDAPVFLRATIDFLSALGASVLGADSPEKVRGTIDGQMESKHPVDLILTDWKMPGTSGLILSSALRDSGIPVVLMSLDAPGEDTAFLKRYHASGFWSKSSSPDELLELIKQILRQPQTAVSD